MEFPSFIDPAPEVVPLFGYWRPTRDWIGACLFRLAENNVSATVIHKGDDNRGTVLIVLAGAGGDDRYYTQIRRVDGHVFWAQIDQASKWTARIALRVDPDLWIIELCAEQFISRCARSAQPAVETDEGDPARRRLVSAIQRARDTPRT